MPSRNGPVAKWETITPERAKKLLDNQLHNRATNSRRINTMVLDIQADRWIENGESIKISAAGNLLDGQHRMMAVCKADRSIRTLVIEGLPETAQNSIDQGKMRSHGDVLQLRGVPSGAYAAGVVRMLWEHENFGTVWTPAGIPRSEVVRIYESRADEIQESLRAAEILKRKTGIPRIAGAASMILISKKNKKAAARFFGELSEDYPEHHAILALLRRTADRSKRRGKPLSGKLVPVIIKAWNAYIRGESPEVLSYKTGEVFPDIESGK